MLNIAASLLPKSSFATPAPPSAYGLRVKSMCFSGKIKVLSVIITSPANGIKDSERVPRTLKRTGHLPVAGLRPQNALRFALHYNNLTRKRYQRFRAGPENIETRRPPAGGRTSPPKRFAFCAAL